MTSCSRGTQIVWFLFLYGTKTLQQFSTRKARRLHSDNSTGKHQIHSFSMSPPKLKRRRMAEVEPWIENLIQNYGENQRETTVKARVVGMCDLSASQRMEHTDACMLFLSDGSAHIPAVLSGAAWERLQELEEKEAFSDMLNSVVYVRNFKLEFDMNPDLASCQFYLKVYQISTICISSKRHYPPSCTSLQSVREQILKTWRSRRERPVNSLSSASGVSLSCLLEAWHSEIIINMLNDAMEKITMSATYCSTVATPTHWHQQRLHWKGREQFIVPVPFLLIPEEQRELMTADPSADGESANALPPPREESHQASTSTPNQVLAVQNLTHDSSPNEGQSTLEHTRLEVLCGTGELSVDGKSPWDMFTPAPDLLESQSVLREMTPLPLAKSTQSLISKQISDDAITLGQRLQPTQISPHHLSGKSVRDPSQEHDEEHPSSPPSWIVQNTAPPSKCFSLVAPPTKPNSPSPPTKPKNVHSDGKPFSYLYHPAPQVAKALSHFQIPGKLIQWAVHYLGTSDSADVNTGADS